MEAVLTSSGSGSVAGTAYERAIATDLVKRSLIAAPLAIAVGAAFKGRAGAVAVAAALVLVSVNYLIAGTAQSWAASKDSPGLLGGTILVSLIFRFTVIVVALSQLRDRSFLDFTTFGIAIVVSHLGLLAWEAKSVKLSLAYPGLSPRSNPLDGKD